MSTMDPPYGAIVTIPQGRGVVRFKGPTSFMSTGKWIGIELYEKNGKNDGSVDGISYFNCKLGYGVFVRPSQIRSIHGSEMDAGPSKPPPPQTTGRSGHQRLPSTSGLLRAGSIKSPPSSNASPRSSSPAKPSPRSSSPAKPSSNTTVPMSPVLPRIPSKPTPLAPSPTKLASAHSLQPRNRVLVRQSSLQESGATPPSPVSRTGTASPVKISSSALTVKRTSSPLSLPPQQVASPPPPSAKPSPRTLSPPPAPARDDQELQELRAKVRVLEARRAEDAKLMRELEERRVESQSFLPKLQAKLRKLQDELTEANRKCADAEQLSQLAENRIIDAHEQLEMVMLDKEVAEERAEIAEAELEEVKEKLAVTTVENDVLKEDDSEGDDKPVKDSLAYIQLEKQNERLKEALIKLRDITQETDQEHRKRISEMEKDVATVEKLEASYEETLIKLANAEIEIEGLKDQLDDALSSEDMVVRLTERNLMLGEKIEEMRITIEDLEALKELSDELEENHVETEKQLHEDLDVKDTQIRDQVRKIEALEESCQDLDNTINQFRELVMQLQAELEQLRTQTQTAQTESASAASQTAAMMSLNLKLQSSAMKNLARNIDFELKSLEARQSKELLSIVQPYLPQLYVESDSDATSCYLFFRRLGYKADLINNVVAQMHNLPEALNGEVSDMLVGFCEMRGRMSALSILCKRFAAVLRLSDIETFLNVGRLYPEISPLEKRIDMHIDLLRRDEFNVMECVADISKIHASFDHLAELHFNEYETDLVERELGYIMAFDHDLDMFSASIGLTKTSVAVIIKEEDVVLDMGGYDINKELFDPLDKLLSRCKSAKVVSKKLIKRLEELAKESSALKPHLVPPMKALSNLVPELVNFGISLARQIMPHFKEIHASKSPFQLTTILSVVKQSATSTIAKDLKPGVSPWEAVGDAISRLIEEGGKLLPSVLEHESVLKISGTPSWVARIDEIKSALAVNVEAERKVAQLNDEIQALARNVKIKDQTIQESSVKIELMERRLEVIKRQAETILELENKLASAKKDAKKFREDMEALQIELEMEQKNAKLMAMTGGQENQVAGTQPAEPENMPIEGSLETSHLLEQIEAFRGTVRFLRMENSYLKGQDLLREIESLPQPIMRIPTPALDPSGNSDTEESDSDELPAPPTLFSLSTETKKLYREVMKYSSAPRVVDLSDLNSKRAAAKGGKVWMPKKKTPAHQVFERKMEGERLTRRVHGLLARASAIGANL